MLKAKSNLGQEPQFYQCPVCNKIDYPQPGNMFPGYFPPYVPSGGYPSTQPGISCPCCQFPPNPRIEELSKYFGFCSNPMAAELAYPCGPYVQPSDYFGPKKPKNKKRAKKKAIKREKGYAKKARKEEIKRRIKFVDRTANKLLNSPCMSFQESDGNEEEWTRHESARRFPLDDPCGPLGPCGHSYSQPYTQYSQCCQDSLTDRVDRLTCQVEKLIKQICRDKKNKDKSFFPSLFPNKASPRKSKENKSYSPRKSKETKSYYMTQNTDLIPFLTQPKFERKKYKHTSSTQTSDNDIQYKKKYKNKKKIYYDSESSLTPTETEVVYRERKYKTSHKY